MDERRDDEGMLILSPRFAERKPGEVLVIDELERIGADADGGPVFKVIRSHWEPITP